MRNIRETLFPRESWSGCSNHSCIVTGPKIGMGTNGPCNCLHNASRAQINILESRIRVLISEQEKSNDTIRSNTELRR